MHEAAACATTSTSRKATPRHGTQQWALATPQPRSTCAQWRGATSVEFNGGLKRHAPLAAGGCWVLGHVASSFELNHNRHHAGPLAVGCELNLLAGGALLSCLPPLVRVLLSLGCRRPTDADDPCSQAPEAAAAAATALRRVGPKGKVRLPARGACAAGCAAAAAAGPLGLLRLGRCAGRVCACRCAAALAELDVS